MRHTTVKPDITGARTRRPSFRLLPGASASCGWALLMLLLGWGSAAPARAESGTISDHRDGPIIVFGGETLNVVDGADISGGGDSGVVVFGGTLNVSGGSITGDRGVGVVAGTASITGGTLTGTGFHGGMEVDGGSVDITGGTFSGQQGLEAYGGSVTISGGSFSGISFGLFEANTNVAISGGTFSGQSGVWAAGGTVSITGGSMSGSYVGIGNQNSALTISGCNLHLEGDQLIGALQDGSLIHTPTYGMAPENLVNQGTGAPQITCPSPVTAPAESGVCSAYLNLTPPSASDGCPSAPAVVGARSDGHSLTDPFPVGSSTVTWTAVNAAGSDSCDQMVTVQDDQAPTIYCPDSFTVLATSAGGAAASFTVPASDNCAGVSVSTAPASGSLFPLGPTTVNCTATDAAGNTATCGFTVTVAPAADLSLTMSASPSPAISGNQFTYTIGVTNNGPQAAQGVLLTDPLPSGTSFVSATRSSSVGTLTTPKGKTSTVSWSLPTLASGQSVTLTLVVKVSAKAGATIGNTARVSSTSPADPNSGNNSSTVSTPVIARR